MKVAAAILAAGKGERFGADKTGLRLGGKPVWRWSFDTFAGHSEVDFVFLVTAAERLAACQSSVGEGRAIAGGESRQQSALAALSHAEGLGAEVLLLQDAARPFTSPALISSVLDGIRSAGAAAPGLPVIDTIKEVGDGSIRTIPREKLVAMQTPQGARIGILRRAHSAATGTATDDLALIEAIGVHPVIVPGEVSNFKITDPEDYRRAEAAIGFETRTGMGYDVHRFSEDPSRPLWLGGVLFPGHRGLEGHSDADALLHAVTDALLGAASLGDIGIHFPPSDPQWKNRPSSIFLRHAATLLRESGWRVSNIDATCIAETPKIMPRAGEIRAAIADAVGIAAEQVSVKATTNEGLGSIGRSEGIAAMAIATILRSGMGPRPEP